MTAHREIEKLVGFGYALLAKFNHGVGSERSELLPMLFEKTIDIVRGGVNGNAVRERRKLRLLCSVSLDRQLESFGRFDPHLCHPPKDPERLVGKARYH